MMGYFKNPAATEQAFAGGWFHSGDLAVREPDGYVKIKDRAKDVIISGGENISSVEVEEALYRHPAVAFAGVVAQPDEKWGETPCAYVELQPGASATEAELIEHCRRLLPGLQGAAHRGLHEIPKTSTGKIQKHVLRRAFPLDGGDRVGGAGHGRDDDRAASDAGTTSDRRRGGRALVRREAADGRRPAHPRPRRPLQPAVPGDDRRAAGGARRAGRGRRGARRRPRRRGPRVLRRARPGRDARAHGRRGVAGGAVRRSATS